VLDKIKGALYGLAVGDALGSTLEFTDPDEYTDFPNLMTGPHTEMVGQGPFCLQPGQVTDDTMMALCLSNSLGSRGCLDTIDVIARYRSWVNLTHDAGQLTKQALKTSGDAAWEKSGRTSAGNGSLMRTTPLGVYFQKSSAENIIRTSILDSVLTHFDPRCALACAAHNNAIAEALNTTKATAEDMIAAAFEGVIRGLDIYNGLFPGYEIEVKAAGRDLSEDLRMAEQDDPLLYDFAAIFASMDVTDPQPGDLTGSGLAITGTGMGFVRVAFRLAFWELLHAPSFEAGMLDTVNRGGDSDTNGAIVGGLLGALYGFESIPPQWVQAILACRPGGPLDTIYHPSSFDDLVHKLS